MNTKVLLELYEENDYPSDRLIKDKRALAAFTNELIKRTNRHEQQEQVADELMRIRKNKAQTGGLPKVGRNFSGPNF